jgi:hypothetical protein
LILNVGLILPVDVFDFAWAVHGIGFVITGVIVVVNYALGHKKGWLPHVE